MWPAINCSQLINTVSGLAGQLRLQLFNSCSTSTASQKWYALTLFFDMSKAFDAVDHGSIWVMLSCLGIREMYRTCFFPSCRQVFCVLGKCFNYILLVWEWSRVLYQNHRYFILSINDLLDFMTDGLVNFTDDTDTSICSEYERQITKLSNQNQNWKNVVLVIK